MRTPKPLWVSAISRCFPSVPALQRVEQFGSDIDPFHWRVPVQVVPDDGSPGELVGRSRYVAWRCITLPYIVKPLIFNNMRCYRTAMRCMQIPRTGATL